MKKVLASVLVGAVVGVMVFGGSSAAFGDEEKPKLAFSPPTMQAEYFQWNLAGIEQKAEELGYEIVVYDSDNNSTQMVSNVQTAVSAGCAGVMIAPVNSSSAPSALQFAIDAGLPTAFIAIGPPEGYDDYTTSISADDETSGYDAGIYICDKILADGGSTVGILALPLDRVNAQAKLKGFEAACEEKGVEIVQIVQNTDDTITDAVANANDILTAHADVGGLYCMSDNRTLGAVQAVENSGKVGEVYIVGSDGSPTTLECLKEGTVCGIVVQEAVGQGIAGVEQIHNALTGAPVEKEVPTPEPLVTSDNYMEDEYQEVLALVWPESAGAYK